MRSEIGGEDSLLRRVEVKARKSSFFQTTEELRPSETRRMAARAARGGEVVVGITGDTNEGYGRPGKTEREAATTYGGYAAAGEKERSPESRNRSSSSTRPSTLSAMVLANHYQPHAHIQPGTARAQRASHRSPKSASILWRSRNGEVEETETGRRHAQDGGGETQAQAPTRVRVRPVRPRPSSPFIHRFLPLPPEHAAHTKSPRARASFVRTGSSAVAYDVCKATRG